MHQLVAPLLLGMLSVGGCLGSALVLRRCANARAQQRKAKQRRVRTRAASGTHGAACKEVPRYGSLKTSSPSEVSLLSWNVLADGLASKTRLPMTLPGHIGWHHRFPLIQMELSTTAADLVALQEVDPSRWEELQGCLPGYQGVIQDRKDGSKMLLALLWKPRLHLVWTDHRSRALLAQFSFSDAAGKQQSMFVINLHLEGSPYRPNDRISQLKSALGRMTARQESIGLHPSKCNVVICGDFNSGRDNCPWNLLQKGRLEGGSTEAYLPQVEVTRQSVGHPYRLQDVYLDSGTPLPWTRKVVARPATLDFIMASNLDAVSTYNPFKGVHGKQLELSCRGFAGLPNSQCPSDHVALGAVLRLRPEEKQL